MKGEEYKKDEHDEEVKEEDKGGEGQVKKEQHEELKEDKYKREEVEEEVKEELVL